MPHYEHDKDYPFAAFITNLGKYNEGSLVGEWVKFPTTAEELQKVFERIGIGSKDDFGQPYEEWFITDYDCYVDGLYDKLGEYENLDELNYLASKLDEMSQGEYEQFQAAMEIGDHSGSIQEIINLTENLDCYDVYPDIRDHDDLGRYYIEELDAMQVPEHLRNYIDYEAYGRDVALEEGGEFTDFGYVRDTGDRFDEVYDGDRDSILEEYRVMTFQDEEEMTQDEKLEMAMDLAFDLDQFFRQQDPQYAAEHPDAHAAKEEMADKLFEGRIAFVEDRLNDMGPEALEQFSQRLEDFKDATGYEEFLDVDPAVVREAIENPDQSHVDEMMSFAEQANREYEAELYGQQAAPTPDDRETGETVRTPRGTFHVTDMSWEQMEEAGYGFHHESEDGKYLIMANGSRAFAIPSGAAPEHTAPEKLTVLVVEPMKEPYVKEIDPGLHALQAEVGGDIAASYPFDDPVGLVLNDEGKLIGLDLNRSLRDEHGEIYDIVAGTFLVVGLGPESFASLPPDMIQKYTEQFKRPELFASINGQIVSVPVEPENPLRMAEMTLEDDYGMIDGIINNGRRGEELEKAQAEAHRTTPEKKPSIRERLEDAKRECAERKGTDKPAPQKKPPELGDL
ncbi:antirestriction protein ArdA [Pseudoflavonifractor phocaeensis]|uniref:antirestriction protein ArdA n=1 Tax=Pseudoflavonifractor phocaeensis TaxID=1870988 RepID=UPI0019578A0B|nr:antirestriction protein ArdA [Pseudoflavonifractor phocaeensis]MBM6871370.1 antirestriction protein ArdA [Pseudoflavonifractor phocaeensis]